MTGQHGFEAIRWLAGSPFQAGFLLTTLVPLDADLSRNSELGQDSIYPILRLSYLFLPKHLQNCSAFCFIFGYSHKTLR
ncbi:hypothetical protein IEQ34_008548 [Dendrobium chrysotoxum]|uniref:Uncharacterized protein n=1 Tax=Dendrobium chrysotoxum TaxID=161865 RepID=A0AAV7GZQ1_DENCH|nr:hypothetical protein IEQ34_008548 [Dendrobium chrysotoxum]